MNSLGASVVLQEVEGPVSLPLDALPVALAPPVHLVAVVR